VEDAPGLLAEIAGQRTGEMFGWAPFDATAVREAQLLVAAGADEFAIDAWCTLYHIRSIGDMIRQKYELRDARIDGAEVFVVTDKQDRGRCHGRHGQGRVQYLRAARTAESRVITPRIRRTGGTVALSPATRLTRTGPRTSAPLTELPPRWPKRALTGSYPAALPLRGGDRTRTGDLWVMGPASCHGCSTPRLRHYQR
jgi:hypothetical protein